MGTKKRKLVGVMRAVLADNVKHLRDRRYEKLRTETERNDALAKDAGIAKETIRRWIAGESAPNLDQIEAIARPLKVDAFELLIPHFWSRDRAGKPAMAVKA